MFRNGSRFVLLAPALFFASALHAQFPQALVEGEVRLTAGENGFTPALAAEDHLGEGLGTLPDLDGDGTPDLLAGAPQADAGGPDRGRAYVVLLFPDGTAKSVSVVDGTTTPHLARLRNGDLFGSSFAWLGDLDGDGSVEVAVGAPGDDGDGPPGDGGRGAVWILSLESDSSVAEARRLTSGPGFPGPDPLDRFGSSLTNLGDLDGNGVPDLAVGARGDDDGGADRGAVWILFLESDASVLATQKISATAGGFGGALEDGDAFGESLTSISDVDGDGVTDLVVGASGDAGGGAPASGRGALWVLFLHTDGTVAGSVEIHDGAGGFSGVLRDGDHFGSSVITAGDRDRNGVVDVVVGAQGDDTQAPDQGALWMLFLASDGTVLRQARIGEGESGFSGDLAAGDRFGSAAARIGDLNGDQVPEYAIGAAGHDGGASGQGAAWVLLTQGGSQVLNPGTGINPMVYNEDVEPPRIGKVWQPFVDSTSLPPVESALGGTPIGHWGGISNDRFILKIGPIVGELLIAFGNGNPLLRDLVLPSEPFSFPFPPLPSLVGLQLYSQAAVILDDGLILLTNGIDIVIGH